MEPNWLISLEKLVPTPACKRDESWVCLGSERHSFPAHKGLNFAERFARLGHKRGKVSAFLTVRLGGWVAVIEEEEGRGDGARSTVCVRAHVSVQRRWLKVNTGGGGYPMTSSSGGYR